MSRAIGQARAGTGTDQERRILRVLRSAWRRVQGPLLVSAMIAAGTLVFIAIGSSNRHRIARATPTADVEILPPDTKRYSFALLPQVRVLGTTGPIRWDGISATAADERTGTEYIQRVLMPQVQRYPASFFEKIGVGQILLCSNLELHGARVAGTGGWSDMMFIDLDSYKLNPDYAAASFQHEIYHFVDSRTGKLLKDPEWDGLNPGDFHYGLGGFLVVSNPAFTTNLREDLPGFVSSYSRSAAMEDKAEVFSVLMTQPEFLHRRIARDGVLGQKARLICQRVETLAPGTLSTAQLQAAGVMIPATRGHRS